MRKLVKNCIKCTKCGDVIESKYTHDFRWCNCKNIFVDGGLEYSRIGGAALDDNSYENLCEYEEYTPEEKDFILGKRALNRQMAEQDEEAVEKLLSKLNGGKGK